MSNILTGFNMQGNDPIDDRIVSKSNLETLEQYLNRVPVQKRYYGLTFFALDKNNELRKYTFQTSLIEPTIDDDEEEIERIDKELQEHVSNKAIHKTSEEIRSEIVDADIPDTIARVQWTLDQINTAVINLIGGASDEYNTLKRIQTKIEELRAKIYGDDGDTVLNTLEQALKFLNQYKDFIVDIPENFVNKQDIVDNLTTDDPTKVLSAKQGKVLSDTLTNYFESAMQSIRTETDRAINAENRIETKLDKEIDRSIKEDQRIDAKLDAEIKRSTDEDLRIDSKLDSEINRSTTEDDRLDKKIDAETTRATTVESNLNTKIETETDRAEREESRIETKLDNEIARSTNKDTEHDNRLTALEGDTHEQNTDLGTTNSTFQLKYNTGNKIKHESDAISVRNAADTDYVNFIAKNATFKGDLLVEGQSFVTEAETVEIKDNLLLLNKGEVGAGVTKGIAGLEIDRGTKPNYQIIFDESDNRFKAGEIGDIQCLALRDGDNSMVNGMFTSWDSTTKRLKTTNIVPSSSLLYFGDNKKVALSYNNSEGLSIYNGNNALAIFPTANNTTFRCTGNNFQLVGKLITLNETISSTFRRVSDNSEVLYHADIVNNLTSGGTNKVLSAEQGKLLQNSITSIQGSYLPLSGGTMTGSIIFPNRKGIFGTLTNGTSNIKIAVINANNNVEIGNTNIPLMLVSNATDLTHYRDNNTYKIWDAYNLPTPASTTDLANYLPLIGGTLTGQLTIKQLVDIKLRLQSTDADNHCIIQVINAQASQLGVFGYAGDKWAIGHNGTYYEIWDKYNLTNPVTYTTNTYNHATLTNKDRQYFTYIKTGTNGLLPHSKVALASGGSGSLGTSDQSFNAAYINNLHTNKVTFGDAGSFIDNQSGDSSHIGIGFYTSQNAACPVYVGSLCVSDSYSNGAPNIPTNGIYSKGVIKSAAGFTSNFRQTNLTLAKTGNDVLYISSFVNGAAGSPGTDSNTGKSVSDGMFLTYFWKSDYAFQLAADIDGTGIAYRHYTPSTGNTAGWKFLADTNWVVSKINSSTSNYLPLTGGTLSGNLTINTVGSTTFVINNHDINGSETFMRVLRKGTASAAIGFMDSLGAYIYNYNSNKYLFIDNDGYARVGTTSGSTRLALITDIPTKTSHITNDSGFITSSALSGYATQSWANGQFAPLSRFNTSTGYTTIKVTGREFNFDSANSEIFVNYRTLSGSTAVTTIIWQGGSSTTLCEGRWGNLYMNDNLVATQSWASGQFPTKTGTGASGTWGISISGNATTATTASKLGSTTIGGSAKPIYLSSGTPTACSATVGSATVPVYMNAGTITQCSTTLGVSITGNAASATNATQLGGTAASSYVKANDNISRLTNDRNYVRSTSTLKVADIQVLDGGTPGSEAGILYIVLE